MMYETGTTHPLLLSIREARRHLGGIGNTKFYRTVRDYNIKLVRLGGRSLVPMTEIERVVSVLSPSSKAQAAGRERAIALAKRSVAARRREPLHE